MPDTDQTWLVCSNISAHGEVVNFMSSHEGKRVPWGGVAVPLGLSVHGQAYCFLPLNVTVPFVVSLNGFFEVPSNRQTIIGHQTSKENEESGQWNKLLIRHAIAPAYISLLQEAALLLQQGRVSMDWYISLFPDITKDNGFWTLLSMCVYSLIKDHKILPTVQAPNVAPVVECSKALYADMPLPAYVMEFVVNTGNHAFCALSPELAQAIPNLRKFDASMCCDLLRNYVPVNGVSRMRYGLKGTNSNCSVLNSETEVLELLLFCYSGCGKAIMGLPLLPLASNEIGVVNGAEYFLHVQSDLLPNGKHLFISPTAVPHITLSCHIGLEDQLLFNLHFLDAAKLEKHLGYALPSEWKGKTRVAWDNGQPTTEWLAKIWKFMANAHDYIALRAWPLIPTNKGLVKLEQSLSVLFLDASCPALLQALLIRAGCAILAPIIDGFPTERLSSPVTASGLCCALGVVPGIENHRFQPEEAEFLRNALAGATQADTNVVKMLQIFPDTSGGYVALGTGSWKSIPPSTEIELEERFLVQKDDSCKKLYELCGVKRLTVSKFHNLILQNWDQLVAPLSNEKQYECMEIMRKTIKSKQQKNKSPSTTLRLLRNIAFVETDKEGAPKLKPSQLYNPYVKVFSATFDAGEGEFPRDKYATDQWIELLIELGLRNEPLVVDIEAMVHCAEALCAKISKLGKIPSDTSEFHTKLNILKSRAIAFMNYVAKEPRKSDKLQTLPYAVVDSQATNLPEYCGATIPFTSYAEAVPRSCVELVWLHQPALVCPGDISPYLKKPTLSQIIDNLLEFCKTVAPKFWINDSLRNNKINRVVDRIYRECSLMHVDEKDNQAWTKLRDAKWILVEDDNEPVFAQPSQIFEDLPYTFPGYFYKIPKEWLGYTRIFTSFGMKDTPTCIQICEALESRARSLNGTQLEPNDYTTTTKLLQYLATFDIQGKDKKTIYAPDSNRVMRDISQLAINDVPYIFANIDHEAAQIQFVYDIPEHQAIKLGAKPLYKVVLVQPDFRQLGTTKINLEYTQKINSEDFITCIARIIRSERKDKPNIDKYNNRIKELRRALVMECDVIINQLIHKHTQKNISKPGTMTPQLSAVDYQRRTIYLSKNCEPLNVFGELADRINELLGGAVKTKTTWVIKLLQADKSKLIAVCDGFGIALIESSALGLKTGELIIQADQQRIRDNPLYTFKKDEWVAWRDGEVYRYGRIRKVDVKSSSVSGSVASIIRTSYEVDVGGDNTKEMGPISLFKFKKDNETEQDHDEEADSTARLQQVLQNPDEYFSAATTEERHIIAERLYRETLNKEIYKQSAGVVQSFVKRQIKHVSQARSRKLRLSNSNSHNDNYGNNEREFDYNSEIRKWQGQHEYKLSLSATSSLSSVNLQDAQRGITQVQNDIEALNSFHGGNESGKFSDHVCFLAQQIVEKALKAAVVCTPHNQSTLQNHSLTTLFMQCEEDIRINKVIFSAATTLEAYYIPTRYFDTYNFPTVTRDVFTKAEADEAVDLCVKAAEFIIAYVQLKLTLL